MSVGGGGSDFSSFGAKFRLEVLVETMRAGALMLLRGEVKPARPNCSPCPAEQRREAPGCLLGGHARRDYRSRNTKQRVSSNHERPGRQQVSFSAQSGITENHSRAPRRNR